MIYIFAIWEHVSYHIFAPRNEIFSLLWYNDFISGLENSKKLFQILPTIARLCEISFITEGDRFLLTPLHKTWSVLSTKLTGKNCFIQFITRMVGWLLLSFLICLHKQISSIIHPLAHIKSIDVWMKNVNHQIDSRNEWLLLQAGLMAKFGLVFVFTLEKDFS